LRDDFLGDFVGVALIFVFVGDEIVNFVGVVLACFI
jgi:hypothetical protein